MASDRTEQPTSRRLRDARKKGQIARSRMVTDAAQLLVVLLVLGWFGPIYVARLGEFLRTGLAGMASGTAISVGAGDLTTTAIQGLALVGFLVGPIAIGAVVSTLAATAAQGGFNVAPEALGLHWDRLNPASGVKRMAGRAGLDLVQTVVSVAAIAWVAWHVVNVTLGEAPRYARVMPERSAAMAWQQAERLLRQATVALVAIAVGDYLLQRWRLQRSLRMTKQEVRDDLRLIEGNPEVKARVRRIQREMVRRRMLAAVPKATVVITNPTHYAVALEYRRDDMPAPRVLAKGKNVLAEKIRAIARDHEIPIVENVPLAQTLYRGVDVGAFIPAELFGAVAEVLAYLIRLKRLVV